MNRPKPYRRTKLHDLATYLSDRLEGAVREVAVYREDFFRQYDLEVSFTALGPTETEWNRLKLEQKCRNVLLEIFPGATLTDPIWDGVGKGRDVRRSELTYFLSDADLPLDQAA